MSQLLVDRLAIESDLATARRRAEGETPGSPAWDAAMEWVDDLERALAGPSTMRTLAIVVPTLRGPSDVGRSSLPLRVQRGPPVDHA